MTDRERPADDRAERREQRKQAERERVRKHGREIGKVYRDAVVKRARKPRRKTK
ncbi:MAG TPA: hypothetical protein VFO84_00075 [Dehalococcoidia bacterium]|nr:hypothetical protein [Dehalococcoidia bacterium]